MSSSRARTLDRRRKREQQARRNRQLLILGMVVAAVAVVAVLISTSRQAAEAPVDEETLALYEDIPQSVDGDGFPLLGDPGAPVQVVEFSSFDCPACGLFYRNVAPMLIERARAGEVNFLYVPVYGTGALPNGEGAARAALCAGEQDAFWPYHSAIFAWQSAYANPFIDSVLQGGVESLALDRGAWDECMDSGRPDVVIRAAMTRFSRTEGARGTPAVLVNGRLTTATREGVEAAILSAMP